MNPLKNGRLLLIFLAGLALRLLFLRYGAVRYYGNWDAVFSNGDTASYTRSFINLLQHGQYTFDFTEPDAAFGRLPGYPFFFGIHYLLFGPDKALVATACTQAVIDSLSILLVFNIIRQVAPQLSRAPYWGALIYAFYPFCIVWVSVTGTETLAVCLVLLWLNALLTYRPTLAYSLGLGLLCAVCLYVREYLGVLLPITVAYLGALAWFRLEAGSRSRLLLRTGCVAVGFFALYAWWPIRNYASFQRVMLLKPSTAGYANYKADMVGFRNWIHCWTNDEQAWLDSAAFSRHLAYPAEACASAAEQHAAISATMQARRYGTSFYIYRTKSYGQPTYRTAAERQQQDYQNKLIGARFDSLRTQFIAHSPAEYWLRTPLLNVRKAFFKSSKQQASGSARVVSLLFLYRTVLLLLGVAGLLANRRNVKLWPIAAFWLFMYLFICFVMRNLEMRYLLQADALLLVPAAVLLAQLEARLLRRRSPALQAA